jgi:hypothetical protein
MAPSCALDETALRAQCERYRVASAGAHVVEHGARRLVVEFDRHLDTKVLDEAIAIERACCPFYELGWEPDRRRLTVSVSRPEHEPALDAIAFALGLGAQNSRQA